MFKYNNYDIVARVRKQEVVYYKEFGYYSGDWLCISRDRKNYYIYKSWFGSCAGCDPLQMENPITKDQAIQFVNSSEKYAPFLVIPRQKMKLICQSENFKTIFPRNFRYSFITTINFKNFFDEIKLIIKSYEGIIKAKEILKIKNIEERRKAIERYGEEKFMSEIGKKIIDKEDRDVIKKK